MQTNSWHWGAISLYNVRPDEARVGKQLENTMERCNTTGYSCVIKADFPHTSASNLFRRENTWWCRGLCTHTYCILYVYCMHSHTNPLTFKLLCLLVYYTYFINIVPCMLTYMRKCGNSSHLMISQIVGHVCVNLTRCMSLKVCCPDIRSLQSGACIITFSSWLCS